MNGQFVISLDFEKFWGVFDSMSCNDYDSNILAVDTVIDRLLEMCEQYDIKLTFATVGFLFNKTKDKFRTNTPTLLPSYTNPKHSPYNLIDTIGNSEDEDSINYAYNALQKIIKQGIHEVSTHTYCHYYCLESGQTKAQFEADLQMAIKVGKDLNINIKSIVFPRNQINNEYLEVCSNNGITSYRGFENHAIYQPKPYGNSKNPLHRILRLSDAYFNITGTHTYDLDHLKSKDIINLPSSNFFRPYNKKLSFLEPFKVKRATNAMTKAAKKNQLFHMWWHPHNFGSDIDENFANLEKVFKTYRNLNHKYNFRSSTMTELASQLLID